MINRLDNVQTVLDRTDWTKLRDQKAALIEILSAIKDDELIDGLLNWLDAIQDAAEMDGYRVKFLTTVKGDNT